MDRLTAWSPRVLSLIRIIVGLMFFEHGSQKLISFPPGEHAGMPVSFSLPGLSGVFEFIGGALIALGLFTRPTAFILSGMMAIGYFTVHAPQNFYPVNNMGDAAILYCFIFLYLVFAGPGPWSIDAASPMRRR
jgi:putative oxidoreductase